MKGNFFKSIFVIALIVMMIIPVKSQSVGYNYKPLSSKSCNIKFSISKSDTSYHVIAVVKSGKRKFIGETTMMIKTFDGQVLKLKGKEIDKESTSGWVIIDGFFIPMSHKAYTAQFSIAPEQFEILRQGVAKIYVTTIPTPHERSFKRDKIGLKLYEFYEQIQALEREF